MEDLHILNERILAHIETSNGNVKSVVPYLSVCVGKLKPSAMELSEFISNPHASQSNSLDVIGINREYLTFCRLLARDIVHGHYEGLIILDIDMMQATVLASMTTQQINDVSRRWNGTIFKSMRALKCNVGAFHKQAMLHYPVAILAA